MPGSCWEDCPWGTAPSGVHEGRTMTEGQQWINLLFGFENIFLGCEGGAKESFNSENRIIFPFCLVSALSNPTWKEKVPQRIPSI